MAIKVCKVPYLNYEPYYFDMKSQEFELQECTPSGVAELLLNGSVKAGPVPTADIPKTVSYTHLTLPTNREV